MGQRCIQQVCNLLYDIMSLQSSTGHLVVLGEGNKGYNEVAI
jgi:hypothetical protein